MTEPKETRELFRGQEKVLEKTSESGTEKKAVMAATLVFDRNKVMDELIVYPLSASYGYEYAVDSEEVKVSPDGTIEFEAFDAKYVIRDLREGEDINNLNPETAEEEEVEDGGN